MSRGCVRFTVLSHGRFGVFCHAIVLSLLCAALGGFVFCHAVGFCVMLQFSAQFTVFVMGSLLYIITLVLSPLFYPKVSFCALSQQTRCRAQFTV